MPSDQQKQPQHRTNKCVLIIIKPLRIIQFLVVLMVFALAVYMIVMDSIPMSALSCIFLIVLSGLYVFILAVDLISQSSRANLHILPMFVCSVLGLFLFAFIGVVLITSSYTELIVQLVTISLCLLAALMFLIDVTAVLAFWKRRCVVCKRCCGDVTELSLRKNGEPPVTGVAVMKCDIATSISDIKLPAELSDIETPDHCIRKIQNAQRREYVDCTTCVPSLCNLAIAEIQTDSKSVSIVESQTPKPEMKEAPMQTLSKCEYCYQQMQPFTPSLSSGLVGETPAVPQCLQGTQQWTSYPAVLQLARGGMPCCSGCKCTTTSTTSSKTQQRQNNPQQPKTERAKQSAEALNAASTYKIKQVASLKDTAEKHAARSSEAVKNVESKISRSRSSRKLHALGSHTSIATKIGDEQLRVRTIDKNPAEAAKFAQDQRKTSGTKVVNSKPAEGKTRAKGSATVLGISRDEIRASNEEPLTDIEAVEKIEPTDEEEYSSDKIERNKGGGEDNIRQHFLHSEDPTDTAPPTTTGRSPKYTAATQVSTTLIAPSTSKMRSKTFPHLKSNKVDPIDDTELTSTKQIIHESEFTELPSLPEYQAKDTCSFCERQKSFTPSSDNSRYYTYFKDKKGRIFCEFCAPLDSKKMTSKIRMELRKPRCANCRFPLHGKIVEIGASPKSNCPKCGRSQRHVASPASM